MTDVSLRIKVDSSETDKGKKSLDDLAKAGANAEGSSKGLTEQTNRLSGAAKAAQAAFTALVGSMAIRKVVEYADEWQNAENRLKLVTSSTEELSRVQGQLLGLANNTRASFSSTAELYTTLTRSTTALGLSTEDLLGITKTINQTFQVSGATTESYNNAIRQLGQGLAAGALRGDEFNSVAEQAPGIMDALAASLKMTRGELREFAATGGISAEILVKALQEYASTAGGMAAKATRTFGQSMTEARNNMLALVGSSDAVKSATQGAGSAIVFLSENLDDVAALAGIGAVALGTQYAAGVIAAGTATTALTGAAVALRAALLALVGPAGIVAAAGAAMYVLVKGQEASADAAWAQAMAFDAVRESLHEMTTTELAQAIQKEHEHVRSLERSRDQLVRASDGSQAFEERIRKLNLEIDAAQSNQGLLVRQLDRVQAGFKPVTEETRRATEATQAQTSASRMLIQMMDNTEAAYVQLMGVQSEYIGKTDTVTTRTTRLTESQREASLVNLDAQDSIDGIVEKMGAQEVASESMTRVTELMRDDISSAFADMMMNGGNAFDAIAKSFERMVYKMVADWAAAGVMNMVSKAFGGAGGATSTLGGILSGGASAAGSAAVSAATGGGAAATGGGILGGIGGAVSSAGSAISGAVAAIPGWGWALAGGAAIAALLSDKSTPSSNAGILLSDLPGVAADRKRDAAPFASGVDPVLFARRDDFGRAEQIAESLRSADKVIMDRFASAGKTFQITGPELAGFSETGMGSGQFLGIAAEDGKVALTAEQSITKYMQELIKAGARYTGTNVQPSGSPDQMLEQLDLALLHGSHANGLNYVPFDGYRAELHRGERVMTANESRQTDAGWSKMAAELSNMRAMMSETARATARTADLLLRVTRDGESLVTVAA
jgi:tape measure domain-containing protein